MIMKLLIKTEIIFEKNNDYMNEFDIFNFIQLHYGKVMATDDDYIKYFSNPIECDYGYILAEKKYTVSNKIFNNNKFQLTSVLVKLNKEFPVVCGETGENIFYKTGDEIWLGGSVSSYKKLDSL